ncbi:Do family serine endopeptidase [Flammeovirgaceae bacterium SG7u.111]|nr:Do family serine endopeptidase [Flammeovirgaceae bacterium SG7u.132]WPO35711.1 Do family serine endopeptidase [Flammeovirgaceae bacterium SG7u.111]
MNGIKYFASLFIASIAGGIVALFAYTQFIEKPVPARSLTADQVKLSKISNQPVVKTENYVVPDGLNFMSSANKVTPGVVHIKTYYNGYGADYSNKLDNMFKDFFGEEEEAEEAPKRYQHRGQRLSSGSGVIISADGYIATNNHVIEHASKIEVVLNDKRSYRAEIVGTDPTTDLALIKIEGSSLPFVPYGDSDAVRPGQWVLAIGNPFDLTSTVTAGIVSAKTRNIDILRSNTPQDYSIESFIQTDAAVNPGNSGGALVDLDGYLIGINTAIATSTGSYSGYSFAVPSALVRKVMDDLLNFGKVQRALMGVTIRDVDANLARDHGLDKIEGVFIDGVSRGSGAENAGVEPGDIVLSIDGRNISNTSELQEVVARNRPGDEIAVEVKRGDEVKELVVLLKGRDNITEMVRREAPDLETEDFPELGARLSEVAEAEIEKLEIEGGVKVKRLIEGRLRDARVEEGFIITHIDRSPINSIDELKDALASLEGNVLIEGIYSDGQKVFYGLDF